MARERFYHSRTVCQKHPW